MTRILLLAALLIGWAAPGAAQRPATSGTVDAGLRLRQIDGVKRVLMIGAHQIGRAHV